MPVSHVVTVQEHLNPVSDVKVVTWTTSVFSRLPESKAFLHEKVGQVAATNDLKGFKNLAKMLT